MMKRLSLILSRKSLLTIYKSFVRPKFHYTDIIYDKSFNESLKTKTDMVQYKATLVITGTIEETSRDRLYQQLGLESLADRRWFRRLFFFHKIIQEILPPYLLTYRNGANQGAYLACSTTQNKIKPIPARTKVFKNSFFPHCIKNGVNSTTKLEI